MMVPILLKRLEDLSEDMKYSYRADYCLIGEKKHRFRYFSNYDELCDFVKSKQSELFTLRVTLNYSEVILKYDKEVADEPEQ